MLWKEKEISGAPLVATVGGDTCVPKYPQKEKRDSNLLGFYNVLSGCIPVFLYSVLDSGQNSPHPASSVWFVLVM